jgi:hypothetical protein
MRPVAACAFALLLGIHPAVASAQSAPAGAPTPASQSPGASADQTRSAAAAAASVVSLDRIKRGLRQSAPSTVKTALRLEYYVEVLGVAPPINLFEMDDLSTGRVPYSAPSYADMRNVMTPPEFRAPAVSFSNVARGGARTILDRSAQRARARRVEDARRKALETEHERQQKLKETVVVSPPK